jgi:uncharacterized protein (DUF362 family)/NAD-dependent dihydropyrimidine dehydrogenase PreA subunit
MSNRDTVSIVKIQGNIDAAVRTAMEEAGGLKSLVGRGDEVYLKPNFVAPRSSSQGVTTDLEIIRVVAEEVRRHDGVPILYETPAIEFDRDQVFRILGVPEFARKNGIRISKALSELIKVDVPGGRALKRIKVPKLLYRAKIINIPKLKTHVCAKMTSAIKNLIGLLPHEEKRRIHVQGVHRTVADLPKVFQPIMTVVDAVNCLEGDGPAFGDRVEMGLIIAGQDLVAVDRVCSQVIGLSPEEVDYLRLADQRPFSRNIRIVGESLRDVSRSFRIPEKSALYHLASWMIYTLDIPFSRVSSRSFPEYLYSTGRVGTNPTIDKTRCDQCGECRSVCPVEGALDIENYRVNYSLCLRCLSCLPACRQQAILVKGVSRPKK